MSRIAAAVVVLAIGAVTVWFGYGEMSSEADYFERYGTLVPGEIVAVAGDDVTIAFTLDREEGRERATAHPRDGDVFAVGSYVTAAVLRHDHTKILIHGTSESPPLAASGLLAIGSLIVVAGVGMILMTVVATPVAGRMPPFSWRQKRHGGA